MKYAFQKIGTVEYGIDGYDDFFLVADKERNDVDLNELEQFAFDRMAFDSMGPGSLFCHRMHATYLNRFVKDRAYLQIRYQRDV